MAGGEELLELVERLGALLRAEHRRVAARHGLTEVHWAILDYLARCNRFSNTPSAVSSYLGATKGTVSQSIKLLAERGLIRKETDPGDRRVVRLSLTPRAREILGGWGARRDPAWREVLEEASGGPDGGRVAAAAQTLRELLAGLQRRRGHRTFQECRRCRHLQPQGRAFRCGLTGEALEAEELERICAEQAPRGEG